MCGGFFFGLGLPGGARKALLRLAPLDSSG